MLEDAAISASYFRKHITMAHRVLLIPTMIVSILHQLFWWPQSQSSIYLLGISQICWISINHKRNASVTIGAALIFSRKISWELILFSLSCRQLSRFKASLNISNYEPYGGSIRKFLLHREESQFFFFSSLFSLLSSLFSFFFYCLFMTFFIFC